VARDIDEGLHLWCILFRGNFVSDVGFVVRCLYEDSDCVTMVRDSGNGLWRVAHCFQR